MVVRNKFEDMGAGIGTVVGGSLGSIGYLGGPLLGFATASAGTALGVFVGKVVGKCTDDVFSFNEQTLTTSQRVQEIVVDGTNEANRGIQQGIQNGQRAIGSIQTAGKIAGSTISLINGASILTTGILLRVFLIYNPIHEGWDVDALRLSSTALTTMGIGIIVFSGMKTLLN